MSYFKNQTQREVYGICHGGGLH